MKTSTRFQQFPQPPELFLVVGFGTRSSYSRIRMKDSLSVIPGHPSRQEPTIPTCPQHPMIPMIPYPAPAIPRRALGKIGPRRGGVLLTPMTRACKLVCRFINISFKSPGFLNKLIVNQFSELISSCVTIYQSYLIPIPISCPAS